MASKAEALQEQIATISKMLKKPENKLCADCKRPSPSWASINLGVFVCITCSGCHREIGVHVTKIKSINLDLWPKNILNNFKKINNKIANKYWEYGLKDFDFKSIQTDTYKLQDFIRDKYERKKWINKKKKAPMDLIVAGKSVDGDDDEDDTEVKKKKKHHHHHHHKKDSDSEDEEEEDDDKEEKANEDDDDDFQEVEEDNKKQPVVSQPKVNANLFDFTSSEVPVQNQQAQIQNNIFNVNGNINIHNNNYQTSQVPQKINSNNGNLLDVFTEETQQDIKAKDLLSSIQQAYTNPQQSTPMTPSMPLNSARPNMSNNLYNTNQNNFFNPNPMNNMNGMNMNTMNSMNAMNMNTMNSMNGMYMNNNMYMNNMSSGYGQQSQFNMNYNNNFGYGNNYQKPQTMNTPFNIDLYNKNKEPQTQRGGSTSYHLNNDYDFSLNNLGNKQPKKNNDPFSNLVSFK